MWLLFPLLIDTEAEPSSARRAKRTRQDHNESSTVSTGTVLHVIIVVDEGFSVRFIKVSIKYIFCAA